MMLTVRVSIAAQRVGRGGQIKLPNLASRSGRDAVAVLRTDQEALYEVP